MDEDEYKPADDGTNQANTSGTTKEKMYNYYDEKFEEDFCWIECWHIGVMMSHKTMSARNWWEDLHIVFTIKKIERHHETKHDTSNTLSARAKSTSNMFARLTNLSEAPHNRNRSSWIHARQSGQMEQKQFIHEFVNLLIY